MPYRWAELVMEALAVLELAELPMPCLWEEPVTEVLAVLELADLHQLHPLAVPDLVDRVELELADLLAQRLWEASCVFAIKFKFFTRS